jgi:alpha-L-rhamnosidase
MMEIYAVKINGLCNPLGYDTTHAVLSWKVRGAQGKKQHNAAICVSLEPDMKELLWNKEGNLNSLGETLDFAQLPYTRYFIQITVRSDAGEEARSAVCFFETGKLEEPWQARWIGVQADDTHPEFQKRFSLNGIVRAARLYICGLGLFEASLNGTKCGNDQLAPFINDYQEHFQYCVYDVTDQLHDENTLSVLLGDGWYRGHYGLGSPTHYEKPLALIAELRISYANGETALICTDGSWQYRRSFTMLSDIYMGETQDYFHWQKGDWKPAAVIEAPGELCARYSPPLHDMERIPVKEIIHTPAGETVLDMGQNFAGHVVCSQLIPAGTVMTWEFGETLQNGNFYHDNYRSAASKFTYVSDGAQREIRPRFTFFGFRYAKVSGLSSIEMNQFEGVALYSEMEQTGIMETGNNKINRLFLNSLWGLKSNFLDMPTDCPQRDERLGWTGDALVFSTTAGFHMDTRAFYQKFLRDLRTDQLRNHGKTAIFLPNMNPGLCTGVWSDVAAFLPNMLYDYYGDAEALRTHYPLMRDWVDAVYQMDNERGQKNLYDFGFQFGDWLALDGSTEQSTFGRTDNGFVCTAYYYASTLYVAKAAEVLGLEEAQTYRNRANDIRAAIMNEYLTPTGRLAIDTQTGYLVALKFGLYTDKQRIIEGLKKRFKQDLYRIKGGFVGATMMNCVLAENGLTDLAYDLLFYEGFPGWIYAINLGATTIWERWNSLLPDGSISGTGMNSLNHYSYGSVVEFLYRYAAGIIPKEPGFKSVRIAPQPDIRLEHMNCHYDSASGQYVSKWRIERDGSLSFHIEIPFDCEAEVILPEQKEMVLSAGSYDFSIQTKKDYRALYSANTRFEQLLSDERAVSVLNEYVPGIFSQLDQKNMESMSKCLNDLRTEALFFGQPTKNIDAAVEALCQIRA